MANSWLRLWHDMPNDPKWRTIARKSGQRIGDVIAVYLHVLVNASSASERYESPGNASVTQGNVGKRGRIKNLCADDIASSLDLEIDQVEQILSAMQGKVLDGELVTGWAKRQPKREDDSAARVKACRDRKRAEKEGAKGQEKQGETPGNAGVTQGNAPDTDKEKDLKDKNLLAHGAKTRQAPTDPGDDPPVASPAKKTKGQEYPPEFETLWQAYPRRQGSNPKNKAFACWSARKREGVAPATMLAGVERYRDYCQLASKAGTEFVLQTQTFLGPRREFENSWEINTGENHAEFRYDPSDRRSYYEQFTEWELRQPGAAGMAAMGADVQNLRPTLGGEEWQSAIEPVGDTGQLDDG